MIDPNKPFIDTRTTVTGETPRAIVPRPTVTGQQPEATSVTTAAETDTTTSATDNTPDSNNSGNKIPPLYSASSYKELIPQIEKHISEFKPLSKEDLEKIRRRQKTEGIISGISDAMRSVANLVATHNYAPDMFDASYGMTAKAKERFEREKARRQAEDDRYFNYAITLGRLRDADKDRGLHIWQLEHGLEREAVEDKFRQTTEERAQAKADRDAAMAQLRMDLMQGKIDEQTAKAREARIEADYADKYWQSRINKNNRTPSSRSGGSRGSGGGRPGEYPYYDTNGNLQYAHSYEAMRQNAIQHGTWNESTQTSTTQRNNGYGGESTSTTTRPARGYSVKPNKQPAKKRTNVNWK